MASSTSTTQPRQRLSLYINSSLGNDVAAAFKRSDSFDGSRNLIEETPAPPPSPIDFGFSSSASDRSEDSYWSRSDSPSQQDSLTMRS